MASVKVDVQRKLDEIVTTVAGARSMPMSASCVINRAELLALLEEVRAALPGSLARAEEVIGGREQLVADAHEEAERILQAARDQRGSLISDTEVARQSQEEADRILAEARREADEIRAEADDYVDSKLANFEVVLTKTIGSVDRGREKLLGQGGGAYGDGGEDPEAPEPSADPATQRLRADQYVDAKLGAVSAVLAKTLEGVARGREKLQGARPVDELGALAEQGAPGHAGHTSDADFLAGLAAPQEPVAAPQAHQVPQQATWSDYAAPAPEYAAQDPYGYPPSSSPPTTRRRRTRTPSRAATSRTPTAGRRRTTARARAMPRGATRHPPSLSTTSLTSPRSTTTPRAVRRWTRRACSTPA
ncbi:hypothetical protein GCM10020000_22980 [Streptomyces olivoverticillatus]